MGKCPISLIPFMYKHLHQLRVHNSDMRPVLPNKTQHHDRFSDRRDPHNSQSYRTEAMVTSCRTRVLTAVVALDKTVPY